MECEVVKKRVECRWMGPVLGPGDPNSQLRQRLFTQLHAASLGPLCDEVNGSKKPVAFSLARQLVAPTVGSHQTVWPCVAH